MVHESPMGSMAHSLTGYPVHVRITFLYVQLATYPLLLSFSLFVSLISEISSPLWLIEGEGTCATGLIWHDSAGSLLRAQDQWYDAAGSALIMESVAIKDGVQFALDRALSQVQIETDALQIVKLWESADYSRTEIGGILNEVKEMTGNIH